MKNIIDVLLERGLIDQMTSPSLREHAAKPIKAYLGFDPTASSLHLGNLLGIVVLAWFYKYGHAIYPLIGGATGRIGDPSGKSVERPFLSDDELQYNVTSITQFLGKIFQNAQGTGPVPIVVNNNDWLSSLSVIAFLRDVGKHFRIGAMLAKESVRIRFQSEEGMSFTEFSYQVLQGYDFHYLNQQYHITLQLGGSDQWGNITAGTELNRKLKGDVLYGLTFPLLMRSDGKKFGKTEEGAIWLSADKMSPYQFYQYLVRIPDADVIRLLKMLTFVDLEEIHAIERSMQEDGYEPNSAQKRLAMEVTRFVHGQEGVETALRVTQGIAPGGADMSLSADMLEALAPDMPHTQLALCDVLGQKFVDLALKIHLVPSKSEGTRLVKNGGAYLNNERVGDPCMVVEQHHLIDGTYLLLSLGKKKRILVKVEN